MTHLVSVVVPNYNHAAYLRQRVDSVLAQTFQDIELILLDDASTDGSLAILESYRGDPRVRIHVNDRNSGSTFRQWNRGAKLAGGKYLWFAESDDWAEPTLVERLVGFLERSPRCTLAACESWYVHGETAPTTRTNQSHEPGNERWRSDFVADGRGECRSHLVVHNTMPNASAVVIRREAFERVGGADESMRLCGDWMLWVRLLLEGDLAHVGEPLNHYRCHTAAVRSAHRASPSTQAEVYHVIETIHRGAGVEPQQLERVLAARADIFARTAWDRRFSVAQMLQVYRAARRVDRRARSRILLKWIRMKVGALRRRAVRPAAPVRAGSGVSSR